MVKISSRGLPSERKQELKKFEKACGIRFKDPGLLNLAFCHSSYSNEILQQTSNNERLEFLGDSVLGLVVSSYLYGALPDRCEGELAKIKSFVVSEDILSNVAKKLQIDHYLLIGKGEENSGGRDKKAILADAMEAVIGALYVDAGFSCVQKFLLKLLIPEIHNVLQDKHKKDYKTLLQEYVQKTYKVYPQYIVFDQTGPDHDMTFSIKVQINGQILGTGTGKNKKEAAQSAAEEAYRKLTS